MCSVTVVERRDGGWELCFERQAEGDVMRYIVAFPGANSEAEWRRLAAFEEGFAMPLHGADRQVAGQAFVLGGRLHLAALRPAREVAGHMLILAPAAEAALGGALNEARERGLAFGQI